MGSGKGQVRRVNTKTASTNYRVDFISRELIKDVNLAVEYENTFKEFSVEELKEIIDNQTSVTKIDLKNILTKEFQDDKEFIIRLNDAYASK